MVGTTRLLVMALLAALMGCRDEGGPETREEARARSRSAGYAAGSGTTVAPPQAAEAPEPEPAAPAKPAYEDEARQWNLEPLGAGWTVLTGEAATKLNPEAVVAVEGPDGCKGAVIVRAHDAKNLDDLEAVARERLAAMKDEHTEVLWFDRVHYSSKGAVRFQTLRRPGDGSEERRQYSVLQAYGNVYEVLAWSAANSTLARHCMDRVTASFAVW